MAETGKNKVVVIGGPTASGKSATALDVAQEFNGVIINADSMQIYKGLPVVTACPTPEDEARIPHRLYQVMDPAETCSAGLWEKMCIEEINKAWAEGKLPVVTGGTGLYIKTLVEGISQLPPIPDDIRNAVRKRGDEDGVEALYKELCEKDPEMGARLKPRDMQRICRALEVLETTGKSLAVLQREIKPQPVLKADYATHVIMPPRDILYGRCDKRFDIMLDQGAIEEVRALEAMKLDPKVPAMKALGVPELLSYVRGQTSLDEAREKAQMQTRRFAKRQCTWFRNQISHPKIHSAQYSESLCDEIYNIIRQFLLT
ncbi:tRNA dimethylallyltransferase [Candidatus Terasakiella magnetica]|uniref:tRNA dimethylallyltransferase n=1 Tax=Candidatus Terasakiella magnetica TaxID=1867952 RepID=A0A1C3RED4_9PROT|nr:tRNA (adenosine(37)-N6)-dimethylallyltransferase MiaA [Candidatus Terasakiella magnetica]SCA55647.1 tRNA dimethylallyltransferase [Candidatus Terasakiella magnetica]